MSILAIAKRDLIAYFVSPLAYVIGASFLFITGLFFFFNVAFNNTASLTPVFQAAGVALLFIIPGLTMHLLAREAGSGTLEFLLSSPVRPWEVVIGKFLAAFCFLGVLLAITLAYVLLLLAYSQPNLFVVLAGYLGLLSLGALLISLGVFASALTTNQWLAAGLALGFSSLCWVIGGVSALGQGRQVSLLAYLSGHTHFSPFTVGVVTLNNLTYFFTFTLSLLLFTSHIVELKR